jgi:uncharacterized protein (TIRG00374 family)
LKKKILNSLKIVGFILIGVVLFWLVYRNQDITTIKESIINANYWWLGLSIILGIMSHTSRVLRWQLLINPLGYKPRNTTLFYSVMVMYLSNLAVPRSGEFVRCSIVNRYEKVPFTALLGTVVTERIIDVIILAFLTIFVLIFQSSVLFNFLKNNPDSQQTLDNLSNYVWIFGLLAVLGILFILLLIVYRKRIKQTKIYLKFQKIISNFIDGLKSFKTVEKKGLFLFHSIFIWLLYVIMLIVAFKAFESTSELGFMAALTVFVMSAFGTVFPSPGGIGSYHFMVRETLFIYGVSRANGLAFAFLAHGTQLILFLVFGLISLLIISALKSIDSKIEKELT